MRHVVNSLLHESINGDGTFPACWRLIATIPLGAVEELQVSLRVSSHVGSGTVACAQYFCMNPSQLQFWIAVPRQLVLHRQSGIWLTSPMPNRRSPFNTSLLEASLSPSPPLPPVPTVLAPMDSTISFHSVQQSLTHMLAIGVGSGSTFGRLA